MTVPWQVATICCVALGVVALGFGSAIAAPAGGKALTTVLFVGHPTRERVWLGVVGGESKAPSWSHVMDGRFDVRLDGHGTKLIAICKDRVPLVVDIPPGSPPAEVEMRLVHGLALDGVVRSDDGRPLGGATVRMLPADRPGLEVPAQIEPRWETTVAGTFSIFGVGPGLHDFEVTAPGHIPTVLRSVAAKEVRSQRGDRVEVELHRAFFVSGRVLDEAARPVDGATVRATPVANQSQTAIANAEGAYQLGPFRQGQAATIWAESPGFGTTRRHHVVAPRDLALVLRRRVVRGEVTHAATGDPIERFRVRVLSQGKKRTHNISSEEGVFAVPVDLETYAMAVDAPGFFPWFSQFATGDGAEYDLGAISLERARTITGRVIDFRSGVPISGATVGLEVRSGDSLYAFLVSTRPEHSETDGTGAFALRGLPDRPVKLSVAAAGYVRKIVAVERGEGFVEVDLVPGATIAGLLVLPDGTPAPGFVEIVSADGRGRGMEVEEGAFRWDGLGDGEYEISANSDAGAVDDRTVLIQDGRSVRNIRLVVTPLGTLYGQITGLFSAEEATVTVRGGNRPLAVGRSFGNGAYAVRGVSAGKMTITAHTTAGRSLVRHVNLGEEDAVHLDLDFTARSRLRGVVTAGERPLGVVRLTLRPENHALPSAIARTNELGQYAFQGLGDGPYRMHIHTGHLFDVDVDTDTVFDIRVPDISLAGTVKASTTGELIARAWLELARVDSSHQVSVVLESHVAGDGSFRFDGLREGEYVLRVVAPQFESHSRSLWITSAEVAEVVLLPIISEEGHGQISR